MVKIGLGKYYQLNHAGVGQGVLWEAGYFYISKHLPTDCIFFTKGNGNYIINYATLWSLWYNTLWRTQYYLNLIMRKYQPNPYWEAFYEITIMKGKKRQRNYSILKETKETWPKKVNTWTKIGTYTRGGRCHKRSVGTIDKIGMWTTD